MWDAHAELSGLPQLVRAQRSRSRHCDAGGCGKLSEEPGACRRVECRDGAGRLGWAVRVWARSAESNHAGPHTTGDIDYSGLGDSPRNGGQVVEINRIAGVCNAPVNNWCRSQIGAAATLPAARRKARVRIPGRCQMQMLRTGNAR